MIESIAGYTDVYVTEGTLIKQTQTIPQLPPMPAIEQIVTNNQITFQGWKHEVNSYFIEN